MFFAAMTLKSLCQLQFDMVSSVFTLFLSVAGEPVDTRKGSAADSSGFVVFPPLSCWVYPYVTQ